MKIGLLGTGFGMAHAAIYHQHPEVDAVVVFGRTPAKLEKIVSDLGFATTTDIESIYADTGIDLVDVCLPTPLHADHVIRALSAGKHVLCELPLANTMVDAQRVVEAAAASAHQVFVDMSGRFDPADRFLHEVIDDGRYGPLKTLELSGRTALLWEGYDLTLDSIALDMAHGSFDTIVTTLGYPQSVTTAGVNGEHGRGSAMQLVLTYPDAVATYAGSSLMPKAYGLRGEWRASFTGAVIESSYVGGWAGPGASTLTEYTDDGQRTIDLPRVDAYAAVIDHVLACMHGDAVSRISPASVLDTLRLTLEVHEALSHDRPQGPPLT